jgi:predicted nucleic acid-binding protein
VKIYFDTNVLIAAALENHPHHVPAEASLRKVHSHVIEGWISAHSLAEFYAVLTRAPLTPPVYPSEAWQILERNVFPHFEVMSLSREEYRETLQSCAGAGWTGGRVYDALHVAAARKADCEQLYTFNLRHFRELAPDLAERICSP